MPCYTKVKQNQTAAQRQTEVKKAKQRIEKLLASRKIKAKVGPQGAITFIGLSDTDRDGVTDVCVYNHIMRTGSAAAKMELMKAEQMAGRKVSQVVVDAGIHSHDGGATWHPRG